ncbi:MAG: adenine phosphoribosyltransferase [Sphingobium sp.]|uniref:adenine phosphoribosyltransferase n=1 Tax=Sphingobium sp. TaxID=1912891 RepID=UPI0029B115D4|nr:adenine phosphoribosyltransferase [Sphingobium sp.]MDX3909371.1 adenine phosphoribosyltransferase [Sphingobium sp.]
MNKEDLRDLVRTIPDFPKAGIAFRDISSLLADAEGFRCLIDAMLEEARPLHIDCVVGIEARGFILGAALAAALGKGFIMARKPGKLPGRTVGIDYALEYGSDRLELHEGQLPYGAHVLLIDDLIATGGTVLAAAQLLQQQGAHVALALFAIDLPDLGGMRALAQRGITARALMQFDGH